MNVKVRRKGPEKIDCYCRSLTKLTLTTGKSPNMEKIFIHTNNFVKKYFWKSKSTD